MTVTLELSADEAYVLQEIARVTEVSIETVLHGLIAQVSPLEREAVIAPEAVAEQKREQAEVEANIRRWHEERASA